MIKYLSGAALFSACLSLTTPLPAQAATLIYNTTESQDALDTRFGGAVRAEQLSEKYADCTLLYDGKVVEGDLSAFHTLFDYDGDSFSEPLPEGARLCLNSPGGNMNEALKITEFLRDIYADLQTYVADDDLCASACALLFLSGAHTFEGESYETIAMRAIAPSARLGVHAPRLSGLDPYARYSSEDISAFYARAIRTSARIHRFAQTKDDEGTPYLTPYLHARNIETPDFDMYYVDTVADALLSQIPVTGVSYEVTLNTNLITTICHNVFMMDDGAFSWSFAPTWKPHSLASVAEFWPAFAEIIHATQDPAAPAYHTDVQIEQRNGAIYGVQRGYPVGGPYYAEDCLVRLPTSAEVGEQTSFGTIRNAWDARISPDIEIRIGAQTPRGPHSPLEPDHVTTPYSYWQYENANSDSALHRYPTLMLFPMGLPLADLPRVSAPTQTTETPHTQTLSCDDLWFHRNRIFHENGYCFASDRGIDTFGNEGCFTKSPELSGRDAELMAIIKAGEKELGC
ncbi:YARHG domain-containing protein [Shimia sp. R10_1]|uniref:YARHG domain-containing protein n=1 Tax=Shimia sp. R10_1 TaxID=2821095 RepID=UPI001ADA0F0A|nr:YARHG domain-containing protein [Shimia sp. R10_1]MBO9472085.1 YARHG domain-containing protein [Shimia sp. R10_1]